MTSESHAWHRQIGIVDQNGLAYLDKTIDGDDDGIFSTLLMSNQLGAFRSGRGVARINREPRERISLELSRGLVDHLPATCRIEVDLQWCEVEAAFGP